MHRGGSDFSFCSLSLSVRASFRYILLFIFVLFSAPRLIELKRTRLRFSLMEKKINKKKSMPVTSQRAEHMCVELAIRLTDIFSRFFVIMNCYRRIRRRYVKLCFTMLLIILFKHKTM